MSEEHKPIKADEILSDLRGLKLILFLEKQPLSDRFEQIMLNHHQLVRVRKYVQALLPDCQACGGVSVTVDDEKPIDLPDIKDHYEQHEIEEADDERCSASGV